MAKTVSMTNPDTGKNADVHPDEVANWKSTGWREVVAVLPPPPAPAPAPEGKPKLGLPNKKD